MSSLRDLYDVPSSPPTSPRRGGSTAPVEPMLPPAPGISPLQTDHGTDVPSTSTTRHKRPLEDLTSYAASVGRVVKLKTSSQRELSELTKLSEGERAMWIAAQLLKVRDNVQAVQVPDALYNMPKTLEDKIDSYATAIILSPSLSAYLSDNAPCNLLVSILEAHPNWGYSSEVREQKHMKDAVLDRIKAKLTDRRFELKKVISGSVGSGDTDPETLKRVGAIDIVSLCERICKKIFRLANLNTTIQFCARIAFLRQVMLEHPKTTDYWKIVDKELSILRAKYLNDERKLSRVFSKILEQDRKLYGMSDLDAVSKTATNPMQRESDRVAQGILGAEEVAGDQDQAGAEAWDSS